MLQSRRNFLRGLAFSTLGLGILVASDSLTRITQANASLRVKVAYFQMGEYVDVSEEYFNLQAPATLRNLLTSVSQKHPLLSPQMMDTMMILVDGAPTKANVPLKEGDEVDLVPLVAGG